jgi:uncharacterized protein (UPF0276 family)
MPAAPSAHAGPRGPLPTVAGIGLRTPHHAAFLAGAEPPVPWVEVHTENFLVAGGPRLDLLSRVRERCELSLHGVGLSLGSADALDTEHLDRIARLVRRFRPALVSDHLAWSSIDGIHVNDLLPMPYTEESLRHVAARVEQVQAAIGQQLLVENISAYFEPPGSTLGEAAFLAELTAMSGCGILLDVNNLVVNAWNVGLDVRAYLRLLPARAIGEIHVAGHVARRIHDREIRIDTHSTPVGDEAWKLLDDVIARCGPRPTLVEWDQDLPDLATLVAEAERADVALANAAREAA